MKKTLKIAAGVLAVLLVIVIADKISSPSDDVVTRVHTYTDGNVQKTTVIEYQKQDPNEIITFTMPLSHLEESDRKDIDAFCKKNSYISCTVNEAEKIFTVTMKASTHGFMLIEKGMEVVNNIASVEQLAEKYPFVSKLGDYDMDGFSEINYLVDKDKYLSDEKSEDFIKYIASCGIYYQLYTQADEYSCNVIIRDAETGEIIDAKSFEQNNSTLG